MNIIIVLLEEDGRLDPESLVGHVAITDGAHIIKVRYAYVDSWFDALIRGLMLVRVTSHCVVDLVEEPQALVFSVVNDELCLGYGDVIIKVGSVDSFEKSLRSAAELFGDIVEEDASGSSNEVLEGIRRFVLRGK